MNSTKAKEYVGSIIATLLLISFIELIGQAGYRVYKGRWLFENLSSIEAVTEHLSLHYKRNYLIPTPGLNSELWTDENGLVKTIRSSATNEKDKKVVERILLIGGSSVEGRGASNNRNTIASHLQSCLDQSRNEKIEIFNAGRSGLYSYTSFRLLAERFVPEINPRLVIQLNGRNDIHYAIDFGNRLGTLLPSDLSVADWKERYNSDLGLKYLIFALLKYSILNKVANKASQIISNGTNTGVYEQLQNKFSSKTVNNALRNYVSIQASTKAYLSSRNVKYIHYFQPTLYFKKRNKTVREIHFLTDWEVRTNKIYGKYIRTFYERAPLELSRSLGKSTIDLSGMFEESETELYVDSVHYNDKASQMIAERICHDVIETSFVH